MPLKIIVIAIQINETRAHKRLSRKIFHLNFSLDRKSNINGRIASLSTPHVGAGCVGQGEVRGADWNINIRRISFIFWTNHRVTIGVFLLADCGPAPLAGNKSINPGAEPHLHLARWRCQVPTLLHLLWEAEITTSSLLCPAPPSLEISAQAEAVLPNSGFRWVYDWRCVWEYKKFGKTNLYLCNKWAK